MKVTKQNFKPNVDVIYYEDTTTITNTYLLNDDEINQIARQIEFGRWCKFDWRCLHLRKQKSYIREIKAHNNLYKLGLWKSHTIDTDLEEDIKPIKAFIYWIIGR